ncbi:hypothetical protein [Compostibacter hankyongensis]
MTESNSFETPNPVPPEPTPEKPRGGNRGLLYGILIVALAGTWGYLIWDKSRSNQKVETLQTQVTTTDSSKNVVQEQYQAALARLDQLTSVNDSLIHTKNKEIADMKARIQSILNKSNASAAELKEAQTLIARLNSRIEGYKSEIEKLQGEKIVLVTQRDSIRRNYDTVSLQNQQLNQEVQLGSVLHASNIRIVPMHLRKNGREVETSKATRADMMRISFDIDENRIADSGQKVIYVCVTAPDGSPLAVESLGSGRFTLADGTEKLFTAQKTIDYVTGEKQAVSIDWKQDVEFKPGDYKVEIYHEGYKIGNGNISMRKGGLF